MYSVKSLGGGGIDPTLKGLQDDAPHRREIMYFEFPLGQLGKIINGDAPPTSKRIVCFIHALYLRHI